MPNIYSQKSLIFNEVDSTLTSIYKKYRENIYDYGSSLNEARDSILNRFTKTLKSVLNDKQYNSVSYDSLGKYIQIRTSKDDKLKTFSWDELNVGSRKQYNSIYQYKDDGKITVDFLSLKDETGHRISITEILHYKIYKVDDYSYLLKGYGSYGGGREFYVFRLLTYVNGKLQDCLGCFNGSDRFFYEIARGRDNLIPEYNKINKEISYYELEESYVDGDINEPSGFMRSTGKILKLKYKNGMFIATDQ